MSSLNNLESKRFYFYFLQDPKCRRHLKVRRWTLFKKTASAIQRLQRRRRWMPKQQAMISNDTLITRAGSWSWGHSMHNDFWPICLLSYIAKGKKKKIPWKIVKKSSIIAMILTLLFENVTKWLRRMKTIIDFHCLTWLLISKILHILT